MTHFATGLIAKLKRQFPEGTPVIVKEESRNGRMTAVVSETVGTVVEWRHEATGAWYAKNGDPNTPSTAGHLQLLRLSLRKVDGEMTDLVIDDLTSIARLEAKVTEGEKK
jgi:hypothetical protein